MDQNLIGGWVPDHSSQSTVQSRSVERRQRTNPAAESACWTIHPSFPLWFGGKWAETLTPSKGKRLFRRSQSQQFRNDRAREASTGHKKDDVAGDSSVTDPSSPPAGAGQGGFAL